MDGYANLAEQREERERERMDNEVRLRKKLVRKLKKEVRKLKYKSRVESMPVRIGQIHIDGIDKTKPETVTQALAPVFRAETYGDLIANVKKVHRDIKTLGCFSRVDILLDANEEDESCLDMIITVKERNWIICSLEPRTSDLCDMDLVGECLFPNILGGGENLTLEMSRGIARKAESRAVSLVKEKIYSYLGHVAFALRSVWSSEPVLWRCGLLDVSGWSNSFSLLWQPFCWLQDKIVIGGEMRRVTSGRLDPKKGATLANYSPSMEECGYGQKAFLSHHLTVDTRDDRVLPSRGMHLQWYKELAGLCNAGDVKYFKHWLSLSVNTLLTKDISASVAAKFGYLRPNPTGNALSFASCDVMSFPSSLACRGWDFKGSSLKDYEVSNCVQTLTSASLKLTSPLPLLRGDSWLRKNLRTSLFCDYGSIGVCSDNALSVTNLLNETKIKSLSAGVGIALRVGDVGRAEINYCFPIMRGGGFHGLQFGLGIDFL